MFTSIRETVRNSDRLRDLAMRWLVARPVRNNPFYRRLYERRIRNRMRAGLERPESVDIESSSFCNARCIMCTHPQMSRKKSNMSWETYEKVVREAVEWGIPRILLSGFGEAFIDKKIIDKVRFAKELGAPWVGCLTNGSLLSEETTGRLIESGLDELSISMDGFSPETYNAIRVGLDFDEVVANVNRLLETRRNGKPAVRIMIVVMPQNQHEKSRAKALFGGRVDHLSFRHAQNWGGDLGGSEAEAAPDLFTPHTVENNRLYPCLYLWTQLNVHSNGDVVPCCIDWDNKMIAGNVREESLKEIWRGRALEGIRRAHEKGQMEKIPLCQDCNFFSVWW